MTGTLFTERLLLLLLLTVVVPVVVEAGECAAFGSLPLALLLSCGRRKRKRTFSGCITR